MDEGNKTKAGSNISNVDEEPEVRTADSLEDKIKDLINNDGLENVYVEVPQVNLDTIIGKYQSAGYKHYKFFFSGGEPTAWKNFIPIVEHLRNKVPDSTIAVNTNLSRPLAWWKKYYHLFDDVVASFHVEFANKEKYAETNIFLCDKVNYLSTKLLMHEERFWEVVEYGEHLKTIMPNYFLEWTPLFDELSINAGPWRYEDAKKAEWISQHNVEMKFTRPKPHKSNGAVSYSTYDTGESTPTNSNDIIVKGQNFFKGWRCNVGDCVFINPVGNVSLASCGQGDNVGHILTDVSAVGPKQIRCGKDHCHCGTDIIIPKNKQKKQGSGIQK